LNAKQKLDSFTAALRKRREQAALQRARTSLLGYIEYIAPTYKPSRVHRFLIEKFDRGIVRCNSPRLMCSKPPQHGKTQLAIFVIEYMLGRDPTRKVVYITYSDDRSSDIGRSVLQRLKDDPRFREVFPAAEVDSDAASTSRIALRAGGAFYCIGRNSALTGRSADCIIVDDIFKDGSEVESSAVCREVWNCYTKVILTRLAPGAPLALIGTRWGGQDLFGMVLTERKEQGWEEINLPALAGPNDPLGRKEGEALWPERFSKEILEQRRAEVGNATWFCLYQGDPTSAEGVLLKPEHWQFYIQLPENVKDPILALDPASKTGAANDWSDLQVWYSTNTGYLLAADWHARAEFLTLRSTVISFAQQWRPRLILIEDTSSGIALIQDLTATTALPIKAVKTGNRNLQARLASVMSLIESGRVFLPKYAPWLNEYLGEMQNFPRDLHDDRVASTVIALEYFRDKQGFFKGWLWESVARHTELVKKHPGMSREELALKFFTPGVPLRTASAGDSQMDAQEGTVKFKRNKHVFGDLETNRMTNNRERVPRSASGPEKCLACGNPNLARYSDFSRCACGWTSRDEIAPLAAAVPPKLPALPKREGVFDFLHRGL